MKVNIKNYEKMNQLARIEFLLLRKEKSISLLSVSFLNFLLPLILIIMSLMLITGLYLSPEGKIDVLTKVLLLLRTLKIYFFIFLFIDLVMWAYNYRRTKGINKILKSLMKGGKEK